MKHVESILFVINKSNTDAYRDIIPPQHFQDPVLTLDKLLEEFECMIFYTYRLEDKLVGVAALKVEKNQLGCIRWVHVLPEHQRKGIGTSLIKHIEKEGEKMRLKKFRVLYVRQRADWARNFYTKLGYKIGDRVILPWGEYAYIYEKDLT